jgi:hypothetical protein
MAKVRVCDRCGARVDQRFGRRINVNAFAYHRYAFIEVETEFEHELQTNDLCMDCMRDYKAFMRGEAILHKEVNS